MDTMFSDVSNVLFNQISDTETRDDAPTEEKKEEGGSPDKSPDSPSVDLYVRIMGVPF